MDILIISLAGIGDTLFATPLIRELRFNFPQAKIDALVMWAGSKDLLEGNPHLNSIYHKNLIRAGTVESLKYLSQLRKSCYDLSFNTHPQSRIQYRIVARLINARMRISHEYDNASAFDRLLVNKTLKQDYDLHSVDNNLALLDLIAAKSNRTQHAYEIYLSPSEVAWAGEYLKANNLAEGKLLGIHVGSGGTKNLALRRWPLQSYRQLISKLNVSNPEMGTILFGGPEEEADHDRLLAAGGVARVFTPKTKNLRQAAALIQKCEAFLSVDTALMHVAAAMKVPQQIVIETPTWNKPIQPFRKSFTLVKNPLVAGKNLEFYRYDGRGIQGTNEHIVSCMESVSVDAVHEAIVSALGTSR
jgi:heptosyltransferase-2